jgi:hypothetical protein
MKSITLPLPPDLAKLRIDSDEPMLTNESVDSAPPLRMKHLVDRDDPVAAKHMTEHALPRRPKPRMLIVDPKCNESITLLDFPPNTQRPALPSEMPLPTRAKLRTEMDDPRLRQSRTDARPDERAKLLIDNDEPIAQNPNVLNCRPTCADERRDSELAMSRALKRDIRPPQRSVESFFAPKLNEEPMRTNDLTLKQLPIAIISCVLILPHRANPRQLNDEPKCRKPTTEVECSDPHLNNPETLTPLPTRANDRTLMQLPIVR